MGNLNKLSCDTPYFNLRISKKTNTAEMIHSPFNDTRVPVELLIRGKTDQMLAFCDEHGLHGYKDLPVNQVEKILIESKQYYRDTPAR